MRTSSPRNGLNGANGDAARTQNSWTNRTDSVIWVNIFDPINGPAFEPHPLKPIPSFMQHPSMPVARSQQPFVVDAHLRALNPLGSSVSAPSTLGVPNSHIQIKSTDSRSTCSVCPPTTSARPEYISRAQTNPLSDPDISAHQEYAHDHSGTSGPIEIKRKQTFAFVKEESLKRPSSRLAPRNRRSDMTSGESLVYRTPPEYPGQVQRRPYPEQLSMVQAATPLPLQLTSRSSEYLERYQPVTANGSSWSSTPRAAGRKLRRIQASLSEDEGTRKTVEQQGFVSELRRLLNGRQEK